MYASTHLPLTEEENFNYLKNDLYTEHQFMLKSEFLISFGSQYPLRSVTAAIKSVVLWIIACLKTRFLATYGNEIK